jgi:rhodanese-related sulfurtransferase
MKIRALLSALAFLPGLAGAEAAAPLSPSAAPAPAVAATPEPLYKHYTPPEWAKAKEHVTFEQAKKFSKDKGMLFVDARAKVEYDQAHIPGAIPLPTGEFEKYYNKHIKRIKKAKKLITYCHGVGCRLSEKTANSLVDKGHKNVAVFFGGWPQWTEHKLPEQKGDTFASDSGEAPTPAPTAVVAAPAPSTLTAAPAPAAAGAASASPQPAHGEPGHDHMHDHAAPAAK